MSSGREDAPEFINTRSYPFSRAQAASVLSPKSTNRWSTVHRLSAPGAAGATRERPSKSAGTSLQWLSQ